MKTSNKISTSDAAQRIVAAIKQHAAREEYGSERDTFDIDTLAKLTGMSKQRVWTAAKASPLLDYRAPYRITYNGSMRSRMEAGYYAATIKLAEGGAA